MAESATEIEIIKEIEAMDSRLGDRRALLVKVALSLAALALLCASYWGAVRERSFEALFAPLDRQAEEYLERTLTKTALTYAGVRGAHAVVSMFKGTQLHPPFLTLSVGEALSPALDIIEKLSDALMLAIASLGAQRILMEIGTQIGLSVFVSAGAVLLLAGIWATKFQTALVYWGVRLAILGFVVRLVIPLMALGASLTSETLLHNKYEEALADIETQRAAFGESVLPNDEDKGFLDRIKSWASMEELAKRVDAFKARAEAMTKSFITLFALFVFETVLFPIASFWLLSRLFFAFIPRKD
ncbi:MAG: hypothetical protein LBF86_05765 [Helicobacteraceae bacterium]|jgi:hypothetical protein|nr:hypothetical protein [Helicobacteraceae bacterium]